MKSAMTIDQILRLALQSAEEQAPLPPDAVWFRAQATETVAIRIVEVPSWWEERVEQLQRAWKELYAAKPELLAGGWADGVDSVGETTALGVIPACLLLDKAVEASIEVMRKPTVSKDGRLVLRARVPESHLPKGAKVEVILLAFPQGNTIGEPLSLSVGKMEQLAFELPPELQEAWREIKYQDWSAIPFRFALRLLTETPEKTAEIAEIADGEAAG